MDSPPRQVVRMAAALTVGTLAGAAAEPSVARFGSGDGPLGGARAVLVSEADLVHTAQFLATDEAGSLVGGDGLQQSARALENLSASLARANSSLTNLARLNVVVESPSVVPHAARAIQDRIPKAALPAVSLVEGRLPIQGALVAIDAVATSDLEPSAGSAARWHQSETVSGSLGKTHAGVLPAGPRAYISGRAADGPGAAVDVLGQLDQSLEFLGADRSRVVQLKCFLRPITDASAIAQKIAEFYGGQAPPLVFVEWLNRQAIEIEAVVAVGPRSGPMIEYLTPPGQSASPVFSRIVRVRHPSTIYLSTLNGRTRGDGELQSREMFADLTNLLQSSGSDLFHLAKATYFVSDDPTSSALNQIRREFFDPQRPPAASKASVRGTARQGLSLAVDMIAVPRD